MVTSCLQNNCSKWVNRFGTDFQKPELVSEQNAWVNPALMCLRAITSNFIFLQSNITLCLAGVSKMCTRNIIQKAEKDEGKKIIFRIHCSLPQFACFMAGKI